MRRALLLFTFCLGSVLAPCPGRAAGEKVRPPFGLGWETCSRELEAHLNTAHAQIVERKRTVDGEVWTVEALPQAALRRAIFTLKQDELTEVELQYGADDWDIWTFDEFMHRVRQGLEDRYGAGRQIARQRAEGTQILQTLVGYTWKVSDRMLELVYFAAQDEKNALRLISLHYRANPSPAAVHEPPKAASAQE